MKTARFVAVVVTTRQSDFKFEIVVNLLSYVRVVEEKERIGQLSFKPII